MKSKIISSAIAGMMVATLACSAEDTPIPVSSEKILVAYYSWGGNTKGAAEQIQKTIGGTLFEIKPEKPYSSNYRECTEEAKRDINANVRPALASKIDNLKDYEVIFVGSPNWWGTIAPPVATFLTTHDLKGKIVIPFFTHGGGGMQNCERDVAKFCSDAKLVKAATFPGSSTRHANDKLVEWVNSVVNVKASPVSALNAKESAIATVAAFAAKGDQTELKKALVIGLDVGVTVNEFKEVLVQLYAYCGFPRSLNALNTLMALVKERGNKDTQGKLPSPFPSGKSIDFGTANQTKLIGSPVKGELYEFVPAIDEFLKAHLFGDIFGRDNLSWKTRELATIAMLTVAPETKAQLNAHISIGKHNGLTEPQIQAILAIVRDEVNGGANTSAFPLGEDNVAYAKYFSGKSYLAPLSKDKKLGVPVANVTFEPGCRNNWHKHTGGQMLIVTGGVGYYQERGKVARRLVSGDIVEIPADVEHWHGAAPDSWFAHLAVTTNPETNKNTWLEPLNDADYKTATEQK